MSRLDLARPRAPSVPAGGSLYESHFLTAIDPAGGRALWLRHTALKRRGQPARPTLWLAWFDRAAGELETFKVTADEELRDPRELWWSSGLGELGPAGARGQINAASWSLNWEGRASELPYLPAAWLYDRPVPRSNGASLVPLATAAGTLTLKGRELSLAGWNATVGHNWGSEHAEEWSWIHAGGFGDDGAGWLDLTLVRIRIGPVLTPWLAAGAVCLDGRRRGVARTGRVGREISGEHTQVSVPVSGGRVELSITAPSASAVSWDYESPAGPGRHVRNCSVADASVALVAGSERHPVEILGGLAVEHGEPAAKVTSS